MSDSPGEGNSSGAGWAGGAPGPVLGVDPGTRRIGLAVSDATGTVAMPLEVVDRRGGGWLDRIQALARERGIVALAVGLPVRMDGTEGAEAAEARKLAAELEGRLGLPTALVDERLTSVAANRAMADADVDSRRRRPHVDKVAAALLLQGYLDRRRQPPGP